MEHLQDWLKDDDYFRVCPSEIGCFHHYKKHLPHFKKGVYDRMPVMFAHYSYNKRWLPTSDVFATVKPEFLAKIRAKKCMFVLDGTHEGWAPEEQSVAMALYFSAIRHNIDPASVVFLSGNLREKANFRLFYNGRNDRVNPISIIEIMHWDTFQKVMMTEGKKKFGRYNNLVQNYQGKFYLNLSRRKRFWRSYCTYKLHEADIAKYGLLSHDKLDQREYKNNKFYTAEMQEFMSKNTPLTVDTDDFETNWAYDLGVGLHSQVLFNLTSETLQSDWNETSLFYSEKTFKPIVQKTPVIIWGQTGQNYNLQRLGYKLYTDWFDYDFDFEPDIIKRWNKLEKELVRVCTMLSKMTRTQQIDWSIQNTEVLDYNHHRADYNDYTISEFLRFVDHCQLVLAGKQPSDEDYVSKNVS